MNKYCIHFLCLILRNYSLDIHNLILNTLANIIFISLFSSHLNLLQGYLLPVIDFSNCSGVNVIKLFSSLLMMRPNKPECLYLVITTFQSSLAFAGIIRSLPKKEAPESSSIWVCFGLALKF